MSGYMSRKISLKARQVSPAFATSATKVASASPKPKERSIFIVPGLPLPILVMSLCLEYHAIILEKLIVPIKYDIKAIRIKYKAVTIIYSSSLPFKINLIGVPLRSIRSRNLFSRYRLYEKLIYFGSFTKRTNVGGLVDA